MKAIPLANSTLSASAVLKDTNIEYTCSRSKAAVSESVSFNVEYRATTSGGSWSSTGVTQSILSDDGAVQQVKALVPVGTNRRRFVRLTVRRP